MATSSEHTELYRSIRAAVLTRHFAAGSWFRNDLFADAGNVLTDLDDPWSIEQVRRENPLLLGANLLTALAIEHNLGHRQATPTLRRATAALGDLYRCTVPGYEGYPIRWDPPASFEWITDADNGEPIRSRQFLQGPDGSYLTSGIPATDPRAVPWRDWETLSALLSEQQFAEYRVRFWQHVDLHRRWEVSTDEMVGLVATYSVLHELVDDAAVRQMVRNQVGPLREWLAAGGFMLTRPVGGFTGRGGLGFAVAAEYPYRVAFARITGTTGPESASAKDVLIRAGLWSVLQGPVERFMAGGVLGAIFVGPLLLDLIAVASATLGPLGLGILAGALGPKIPAVVYHPVIQQAVGSIDLLEILWSLGLYLHRDCVDVIHYWEETNQRSWRNAESAGELAIAAALLGIQAGLRMKAAFTALGAMDKALTPQNFSPYLALAAAPAAPGLPGVPWLPGAAGNDPHTVESYGEWFRGWWARSPPELPPAKPPMLAGPDSAFACAVALITRPAPDLEGELLRRLDALHAWITTTDKGTLARGEPEGVKTESVGHAVDYLGALAIAWLHERRLRDAGAAVATAGFPKAPTDWTGTGAGVAGDVLAAHPRLCRALGVEDRAGAPGVVEVLSDPGLPSRVDTSPAPAPPPTTLLWDGFVLLPFSHIKDVPTGVWIADGDEWELSFLGTTTKSGGGRLLPDGDVDDARFPLHRGLDPDATLGAVLARLGGWVQVGRGRPRERFTYPHAPMQMYVRCNAIQSRGRGRFIYRCRVWRPGPPDKPGTEVTCVTRRPVRIGNTTRIRTHTARIGGIHAGGTPWHVMLPEAIRLIDAGHEFIIPGNPPRPIDVHRRDSPSGIIAYLKARGDKSGDNNLLRGARTCKHQFP